MMVRHNLYLNVVKKIWVTRESGRTGREVEIKKVKLINCEWREETGSAGSGRTTSMRLKKPITDKKLKKQGQLSPMTRN